MGKAITTTIATLWCRTVALPVVTCAVTPRSSGMPPEADEESALFVTVSDALTSFYSNGLMILCGSKGRVVPNEPIRGTNFPSMANRTAKGIPLPSF
jgi:hypothetical protein